MKWHKWIAGTGAVVAVLWVATSCQGPERAPRQPIDGVDRPYDDDPENEMDEKLEPKGN